MSDYPDWQGANEPMQAALARLHHLHRSTGQVVPEAQEHFYESLQNAYFLIPHIGPGQSDESGENVSFAFYFEPYQSGVMLSIFSSVERARAFFGPDDPLHRMIQRAPDFFAGVPNLAARLGEQNNELVGVLLDRGNDNFYFFSVPEIVALGTGGRVIGPTHKVDIRSDQIEVSPLPADNSPLTSALGEALCEVMRAHVESSGARELWAFEMTVDGQTPHLGLAIKAPSEAALAHLGPLIEKQWQELGPAYAAFDLTLLAGSLEAPVRAHGTRLWNATAGKKSVLRHFKL